MNLNQNQNWKDHINKKAMAIVRRSSHGQKDNTSAESQQKDAERYCKANGLEKPLIEEIIESAYKPEERTKYYALKAKAKRLGIKHIVFSSDNRDTRNLTDTENNEREVREGTFIFHYVVNGIVLHQGSPDSDFLMREYHAVNAKAYSRDISTKVKRATITKAEAGWWPYRHTPLGYIQNPERDDYGRARKGTAKLAPSEDEQEIAQVRREFELRSEGRSYDEIAEIMKAESWPIRATSGGYRSGLTKRLKNPLYWGEFQITNDPRVFKGRHELIIPKEHLRKVKMINEGHPARPSRPWNKDAIFGGGWLRCGHPGCGLQISYEAKTKTLKSGEEKVYRLYRCTDQRKVHEWKPRTPSQSENAIMKKLEDGVCNFDISEQFAKDISDHLNRTHQKALSAHRKQAEGHRKALTVLEQKENRIFDHFDSGVLDRDNYIKQRDRIRSERDHYNHELERLNLEISDAAHIAVQTVLELATNAKSLLKTMTKEEKVEYFKRVYSNPKLDSLSVDYHLQKPFEWLAKNKENKEWRRVRDSNPRGL